MDLFVCSSHYQLLNAIMIVKEYDIEADLIIIRESVAENCDLERLRDKCVFKSIFVWKDIFEMLTDEKIKSAIDKVCVRFRKIKTYIHLSKVWDSLPNKKQVYKKVHIAYIDSITLLIYSYFKQSGSQLSLFEDGTYSYGCLSIEKTFIRRIVEKVFFRCRGIDECVQLFVKHPELVDKGRFSDVVILPYCGNPKYDVLNSIILPLYKINRNDMTKFKKKIIFFDSNLEMFAQKKLQKKIAVKTIGLFGKENVLVKLHPSSRDTVYGDNVDTFNGKLPFEIVMSYEQMEKKILVSIFSTACMAPKRDFNQEPYVIFTYKIFKENLSISSKYTNQIEQLKESYQNEDRIYVPDSIDEYVRILQKIKEKI